MQNEQEFYRCLVSDAAGRTLKKILEIIRDAKGYELPDMAILRWNQRELLNKKKRKR